MACHSAAPDPCAGYPQNGRQARGAILEPMQQCAEALNAGDNMLIYRRGLSRDGREYLGGNRAVHFILERGAPMPRGVSWLRTRGM